MKGYMTVEAALVFPIALSVIVFIIYAGFYRYDQCVLTIDCCRAALEGAQCYRYPVESATGQQRAYNEAYDRMGELVDGQVISMAAEYAVEVEGRTVRVSASGRMQGAGFGWSLQTKADAFCMDPVREIRLMRRGSSMSSSKEKKE